MLFDVLTDVLVSRFIDIFYIWRIFVALNYTFFIKYWKIGNLSNAKQM
jgi:hypothetical protein